MIFKKKDLSLDYKLVDPVENDYYTEAILQLQSNIELSSIDNKVKVIGITSSKQDEGKSTLAANLAHVYGLKGYKVLFIDLDLRRPTAHRFFSIENKNGIVDYCVKNLKAKDVIRKVEGVDFIPAGDKTPFPTQIINSEIFKNFIAESRKKYDYIIIDTPPVEVVTDAVVAGNVIDGYVFVCRSNSSHYSDLKDSLKIMKENNLNVIGVSIVDIKKNKSDSNYYYYSYKGEKK